MATPDTYHHRGLADTSPSGSGSGSGSDFDTPARPVPGWFGNLVWLRSLSIRTMLGLMVLICILPIALVAVGVISHDYQRERDQLLKNTVLTSRSTISVVDQVFTGVETSLAVLETSPTILDPDHSKFYFQAQAILDRQLGRNILLTDTKGKQLVNTLFPYGAPLPEYTNSGQVAKLRTTHAPVVADFFSSAADHKPMVAVAIPILRNGVHLYNISTGLPPSLFSNVLAQQGLPNEWVAAIVDSSGTIIARTRENDKFLGTRVSPDLLNALLTRSEGIVKGKTLDGISVVAGYSQSDTSGWTTVIAIPEDLLTKDLHRRMLMLASGTVVTLLAALGFARLIGGRIIDANRGLIAPALALGEGKPINVPRFGLREADEIGEALSRASQTLLATRHRANHDDLTSLPNRGLFYEVVARQLTIAARNESVVSVLFIDLDGFKRINDQFGHAAGDEALRLVAARLEAVLRSSDTSSRLGGDEFAVALVDTDLEQAVVVGQKLVEHLSVPYCVTNRMMSISASIGVAASNPRSVSVEALVRAADDAMYVAKAEGKARVSVSGR